MQEEGSQPVYMYCLDCNTKSENRMSQNKVKYQKECLGITKIDVYQQGYVQEDQRASSWEVKSRQGNVQCKCRMEVAKARER